MFRWWKSQAEWESDTILRYTKSGTKEHEIGTSNTNTNNINDERRSYYSKADLRSKCAYQEYPDNDPREKYQHGTRARDWESMEYQNGA